MPLSAWLGCAANWGPCAPNLLPAALSAARGFRVPARRLRAGRRSQLCSQCRAGIESVPQFPQPGDADWRRVRYWLDSVCKML